MIGHSVGFSDGREAERKEVVELIRGRAESALRRINPPVLTEGEAKRLKRWLDALADDIEAGLHSEDEEG